MRGRKGREMRRGHQPERIWSSGAQRQAGFGWLEDEQQQLGQKEQEEACWDRRTVKSLDGRVLHVLQ